VQTERNWLDLAFVGDVSLGGRVRESVSRDGPARPWSLLGSALKGADAVVGNLECCVVPDAAAGQGRLSGMATIQSSLAALPAAGIGIVSLANNHMMDAGAAGLETALNGLARYGVRHVGAGHDLAAAEEVAVVSVRGYRLGLIAACDQSASWAGPARAGVAPLSWSLLERRVRGARPRCDVLIVMLHADYEFSPAPAPARIRRSRRLAAAGADLVIQHHPHVLQGIETHGSSLIAYSLGNFVMQVAGNAYQEHREGTRDSIVLRVRIRPGVREAPHWRAIPVALTEAGCPALVDAGERRQRLAELRRRSALLSDAASVRRHWRAVCRREVRQLYYNVAHAAEARRWRSVIRTCWESLARPDMRRGLLGWISGGCL